jgi:hypothetical protein
MIVSDKEYQGEWKCRMIGRKEKEGRSDDWFGKGMPLVAVDNVG